MLESRLKALVLQLARSFPFVAALAKDFLAYSLFHSDGTSSMFSGFCFYWLDPALKASAIDICLRQRWVYASFMAGFDT